MRGRTPYELFRVEGSPFWYVYFLDREGRRIRKSTKESDQARAHAVARDLERRHADPTYKAQDGTSVAEAAGTLREHLTQRGRAKATIEHFYEVKLAHVQRVFGADAALSCVTAKSVDGYIQTRRAEGAHPHTIAKELTALRMLLKVARRRGEFALDVSQVMPVGYATGYKPVERRVTREQAWGLIAALPEGPARYVAFVCATTGRDLAARRALGGDLSPDGIKVRDRKTKRAWRTVPLTKVTKPFAERAFAGVSPAAPVAPGASSIRHALDRACARLGWGHLSPNDLRRSVAHWLLEDGVPRDLVAAFFGHGSTRMLDLVYGKIDPKELGAGIARILGE